LLLGDEDLRQITVELGGFHAPQPATASPPARTGLKGY
jgi:hypothetical protein